MTKPEPSEFERRGAWGCAVAAAAGRLAWPRRLKNSSKSPRTACRAEAAAASRLRASTVVEAEILTTASVTWSARSAKDSGVRRALRRIERPERHREGTTARHERPPETRWPGCGPHEAAQEHSRWSIDDPFRNGDDCGSAVDRSSDIASFKRRLRRKRGYSVSAQPCRTAPHDRDADDGGDDPDDPHPLARAMRGLIHRAPHPVRESREQDALDRESEAEGCDEVEHRRLLRRVPADAGRGRARRRPGRRPPGRVVEVAEEVGVRAQAPGGYRLDLQPGLVGLHGAVEGEEVRIAARTPRRGCGSSPHRPGRAAPRPGGWPRPDDGRLALGPARMVWRLLLAVARAYPPPRAPARSACAGKPPGCSPPADRRGSGAHRPSRCQGSAACRFTSSWMRFISSPRSVRTMASRDALGEHVTHGRSWRSSSGAGWRAGCCRRPDRSAADR